jgi:hypothetical protein
VPPVPNRQDVDSPSALERGAIHPVAGLARKLRGRDHGAGVTVGAQKTHEREAGEPRLVSETQLRTGMGGLEFFSELSASSSVPPIIP